MIVVVTALFGAVADRIYPCPVADGVEFLAFTDRTELPPPWQPRPPVWVHRGSARRTARYHKVMAHVVAPQASHWLWLDACLELTADPAGLFRLLGDPELAAFRHPDRTSVEQEVRACRFWRKDNPAVMNDQIASYRAQGLPVNHGLAETALLLRRNTLRMRLFNERWWEEIVNHSLRDQLSFPYVCWKLGVSWAVIPGRRDRNDFAHYHPRRRGVSP